MSEDTAPLPIVSCDGHIGPRLVADLRPYCPQKYLQAFDDYVIELEEAKKRRAGASLFTDGGEQEEEARMIMAKFANIQKTAGHYDVNARLRDMDEDGITAEVLFPTTHNGESEPFIQTDLHLDPTKGNTALFAVGQRIYAEWLADACKASGGRLLGLVTPPMWDIEAAVKTVEWAAKAGLRGVYLLAPRSGVKRYDDPAWEPFWAACASNNMTLNAHAGAPLDVHGPHAFSMHEIETGGWPARMAAHQMVFSGVFERHPTLKVVFTEQNFDWWVSSKKEFDSSYRTHAFQLRKTLSRRPSEYFGTNLFIGASFLAPFEAEDAVEHGYVDNVIWGSDYGHIEGTFQPTDEKGPEKNPTRLSMRYAFAGQKSDVIRKMVSDNGMRVYGLDRAELTAIAQRIGSPSVSELQTPIQAIPEYGGMLAFRQIGAWG